jgi:hypothetical protein
MPSAVSYHVGRDGFYFPGSVVARVQQRLDYRITMLGKVLPPNEQLTRSLRKHNNSDEAAQTRAAINELFPRMPDTAVDIVVKKAFQKVQEPRKSIASQFS